MLQRGKVTIIGDGLVGSTTAFALMHSSVVNEVVIIDINRDKAEGDALDMSHGVPFIKPINVYAGDYADTKGSEIVIITAGANQKPDETRLQLLQKNKNIFNSIITELKKHITEETIILVVTNPVDILTYLTLKISEFPKNKVIGSGTVLDTARLRYLIGKTAGVDARNVHAYILGEHGDSEVAAWSGATIGSVNLNSFYQSDPDSGIIDKEKIAHTVTNAAYEIIEKKGATFYAIALCTKRIVECILRNENSILTVSSYIDNMYGVNDVCMSVPTIVGRDGASKIIEISMSDEEFIKFQDSARTLKEYISQLE